MKEAFQVINYFVQHEKIIPIIVHALQKIKNEAEFNLGTKKTQATLNAYFAKTSIQIIEVRRKKKPYEFYILFIINFCI